LFHANLEMNTPDQHAHAADALCFELFDAAVNAGVPA